MPKKQSFYKTLKGYGKFTKVIASGKQIEKSPIKAFVYFTASDKPSISVGFTATKSIRKATQRNCIKRCMKEAFRANKNVFLKPKFTDKNIEIVFMYTDKEMQAARKKMVSSINLSIKEICVLM